MKSLKSEFSATEAILDLFSNFGKAPRAESSLDYLARGEMFINTLREKNESLLIKCQA